MTSALLQSARAHGLLDLRDVCPDAVITLPYATPDNIAKEPLYAADFPCLIHEALGPPLAAAAAVLRARSHRLLIWDAYRPPEAQTQLWELAGAEGFVHKPGVGGRWSWHCYGRAIDLTLADATGMPQVMPSAFDDFSPAAASHYAGGDSAIASHLEALQSAMTGAGFHTIDSEWWHFCFPIDPPPASPVWWRDLTT
jgi:zinc D-Ala-D-Ala dipeptidase